MALNSLFVMMFC